MKINSNKYLSLEREFYYEASKDGVDFIIQVLVFEEQGINATGQHGAIARHFDSDLRSIIFSNTIKRSELSWGIDIVTAVEQALNKSA